MPIKLVFHGGLFTVLPGTGPARRVDVHMRSPFPVQITGKDGKRIPTMEALLNAASRIDFETTADLKPEILPLRPISHLIPIDYHGFHKTVSFTGGTVAGVGEPVARKTSIHLNAVKNRADAEEMLHEFRQFAGVTQQGHYPEYSNELVQEFFSHLSPGELRAWMAGYRIEVTFPSRGTYAILNGYRPKKSQPLPDGLRVDFPFDPKSTIPHYPLNNPHVLEQPPTI